MASNPNSGDVPQSSGPSSPRTERAKLEEALGKMAITHEEATPLVIDDREDDKPAKWLLAELYCPNPGPRDAKGGLPFGPKLRASDDWKKAASGDSSNKEHYSGTSNQRESKNSTTKINMHGSDQGARQAKQFRYENVWQTHLDYEQLVASTWQAQQRSDDLQDFTRATVPHSASATWRAIVAGREALNLALIHRIGDGSSVSVWDDRWIPSTRTMTPTVKPPGATVMNVSELLHTESGTWRVELVRANFAAVDAAAILNIPLRRGGGADFLAWAHEKSGNYIVKSAYRALMTHNEQLAQVEGQVTDASVAQTHLWKLLWALKVVPKVRVFWWRVLRGILPDESTLKYRHIKDTSLCKLCMLADENLDHALIHCSHARTFWVEAHALLDFQLPTLHPDTWRKDILTDPRWTHDGESFDPVRSIKYTREALALLEIPIAQAATLPGYGWLPPEGNQVKINTDAAVDILRQQCAAGGVARSRGSLLGAWAKPHAGVTDPLIAETLALREGVIFASLRGFSDVVMETDCQEVVNLWHDCRDGRSVVAPINFIGD
ncbi:Alanyl-tRNA synthetase [Hordeum vulgare]|nr:Alanyl-tRNA synthetase [Hordeum vulgare]